MFSEVLDKINKEYVEDVNQSDAMDAAINGVLQSLDPYSAYMTPELYESMQTETSGEFGGLGIEVSMEAGVIKVISPIDNTPASRVGVKAGDYIVKINDIQVQGKSLSEAVNLMRGPVGTDIEITVRRRGKKKALVFKITREIIKVASVKSKIIDEKTGYLRLTSFNENSSTQIKKKLKELNKIKKNSKDKLLVVVNKIDLNSHVEVDFNNALFISAKNNEGLDPLKDKLLASLIIGCFFCDHNIMDMTLCNPSICNFNKLGIFMHLFN